MNEERVAVCYVEQGRDNWPIRHDTSAPEFIAWMNKELSKVPEEYRDAVVVAVDSYIEDSSTYATIEMFYYRPRKKR